MRRRKQRVISLLLVVSMIFGLTQGNVLQVKAQVTDGQLQDANGVIWLTKNAAGDNVSDEFSEMVQEQFKLDDMVRDALGLSKGTKVYFEGVDIGNPIELYLNMDKVESMVDDMREAVQDKKLLVFNIGEKDGAEKKIAFRNVKAATISAGDENIIYINHPGAPASAADLKTMIETALNNTVVSVTDEGTISINLSDLSDTVDLAENKAQLKSNGFKIDGGLSYSSLLKKWPTVTVSSDPGRKAGEVTITIEAAEYSQYNDPKFVRTVPIEVWMVDQRVNVNAAAYNSKGELVPVGEKDASGNIVYYTASYSGTGEPSKAPVLEHYRFSEWKAIPDSGYDYTAIMIPKVDNNKNGIHDELETLAQRTVKYYVDDAEFHSETVAEGNMPKGPDSIPVNETVIEGEDKEGNAYTISYVFSGWNTEKDGTGTAFPAKVLGDTAYYAIWKEVKTYKGAEESEPVFTVTGIFKVGETEAAPVPLNAEQTKDNSDGNGSEYQIINPGWAGNEDFKQDGFECIGWYYYDKNGTKVIFDIAEERWNTNNGYELELYCEFVKTEEVMDQDGEVTDEVLDEAKQTYKYNIQLSDGRIVKIDAVSYTEPDDLKIESVLEKNGIYEEKYNPRITTRISPPTYKPVEGTENEFILVPAQFESKMNKVEVIGLEEFRTSDVNEVAYEMDGYRAEVIFAESGNGKGEDVVDGEHTYAVDAEAKITVTPFSNGSDIKAYLVGLNATYGSSNYTLLDSENILHDEDYSISITGSEIISKLTRTKNGDSLGGVTLMPEYQVLRFEEKANVTFNAGGSYSEETVYDKVINDGGLDYVDSAVEIIYKAQENSYDISLQKLFDLLEADGLGALKPVIEKALEERGLYVDSYEVKAPNGQGAWADIEDSSSEVTAQEAADKYIAQKYKEYRNNTSADIMQLAADIMSDELVEAVYNEVHHKFGYVGPGETTPKSESLKVTYTSDKFGAVTAEPVVSIVENRKVPTITATGVTSFYGEKNVDDKIVNAVKVTFNGTEVTGLDRNLFVIYDAKTNTERDLDNVSATTYKLRVAFKGNTEYAPVISDEITLTVKKVDTTVTVEPLITVMKGADYYSQAKAKVTNKDNKPIDAPIVQIVAGIAIDELAYGLKTEGNVKDWSLGFDDENLMADVWVKLPQSYLDMLTSLEMETLEPIIKEELGDIELPKGKLVEGAYYPIENLEEALERYDIAQVDQLQALLDEIPTIIQEKLGISDLTYGVKVRFDALEDEVYPTNSGFYVNYAATLSRFNNIKDVDIEFDKNYSAAEDYGFIVISPMAPIPNRGGVQLYDDTPENAKDVFVYEYDCKNKDVRDLKVAVNGKESEKAVPFYYGLTTRFGAKQEAPSMPGVYFAGYNYTTTVNNEDSGKDELRRLGSDSAIIIIKQQEADLTITGGTYEYKEVDGKPVNRIADIKITDKNGKEIDDDGVTVISGTVNVDDDGTNVTANDLYGTVNIDMPDALKDKWDTFCEKGNYNNKEKIVPGDFITFLEECRNAAVTASNAGLDAFKDLAMKDAVSAVLGKINVSPDSLVSEADKVQNLLDDGVAYYNKLIEQLEPLEALNDNLSLTFYDLEKDADKLDYGKTGYYLYMGVITDPDMTVDAAKGLVIIHSEDDYIMKNTHVPYNGKEQTIYKEDGTNRSDVTVMVKGKEISFFLESDAYEAMNKALAELSLVGEKVEIKDGSDVVVSTIYENAEGKANEVYSKLFNWIWTKASIKVNTNPDINADERPDALKAAEKKLKSLTGRLLAKLQAVDGLDGYTSIIFYEMSNDKDLKGMPVNAGTYQFYGYDYDVSATRGTLVIEPICIEVDDGWTKEYGAPDPVAKDCIDISYYYKDSNGDKKYISEEKVPDNINDLISYDGYVREDGIDVGLYDMNVKNLQWFDNSGNYKLDNLTEDGDDFEIIPAEVIISMDSFTVKQGDEMPEFTYTITGLKYDDTLEVVPTCEASDTNKAGIYKISAEEITHKNYIVKIEDGEFTVEGGKEYKIGMQNAFRVNEPWALRAIGNIYPVENGVKAEKQLTKAEMEKVDFVDFGIYFLRSSDTEKNVNELTLEDFTGESSKAVLYSKGNAQRPVIIREDGSIAADFDEGIYADQLSESIYTLYYVVDGTKVSYSSIQERNPIGIIKDRMNEEQEDTITVAVYDSLLKFEEAFLNYIGDNKGKRAEKQDAPTLGNYSLPKEGYKEYNVNPPEGRCFSYTNAAALVEPWSIRFNALINNDATKYQEYGFVVFYDKEAKYKGADITVEQLLAEESAYVFSTKNDDVTVGTDDDGRAKYTAIYNNEIYTYQIDNAAYVMFYVFDGADYYYGPVKTRVILNVLEETRKDMDRLGKKVIDKMIALYESVDNYHKNMQ